MKHVGKARFLPVFAAGAGAAAFVLRKILYVIAVDDMGLLVPNHPVDFILAGLSGAVLLVLAVSLWKLDGSAAYADNFGPSQASLWGHLAGAAGIFLTVFPGSPQMEGYLGTAWMVLGGLSPLFLVLAGLKRAKGTQPFFLFHLTPSLFFVVHIINQYQRWCGNPQIQDDIFSVFGSICLMFFAFYTTCFDVGAGKRRRQLFMGLMAVYLLTADLANSPYPLLYLGGIVWALTDLCTFAPKPKPQPEEKKDASHEN